MHRVDDLPRGLFVGHGFDAARVAFQAVAVAHVIAALTYVQLYDAGPQHVAPRGDYSIRCHLAGDGSHSAHPPFHSASRDPPHHVNLSSQACAEFFQAVVSFLQGPQLHSDHQNGLRDGPNTDFGYGIRLNPILGVCRQQRLRDAMFLRVQ